MKLCSVYLITHYPTVLVWTHTALCSRANTYPIIVLTQLLVRGEAIEIYHHCGYVHKCTISWVFIYSICGWPMRSIIWVNWTSSRTLRTFTNTCTERESYLTLVYLKEWHVCFSWYFSMLPHFYHFPRKARIYKLICAKYLENEIVWKAYMHLCTTHKWNYIKCCTWFISIAVSSYSLCMYQMSRTYWVL